MKELDYGKGYRYAHDEEDKVADMDCLPPSLLGRRYYEPTQEGREKQLAQRLSPHPPNQAQPSALEEIEVKDPLLPFPACRRHPALTRENHPRRANLRRRIPRPHQQRQRGERQRRDRQTLGPLHAAESSRSKSPIKSATP
jgi:hypothetical protein